jgi:hypothetical protein
MVREGKYFIIARYGEMWGKEKLDVTAGEIAKVKIKMTKDAGIPKVASN